MYQKLRQILTHHAPEIRYGVFSLLMSGILTSIFLWGLSGGQFLFLHDEFLLLNKTEAVKSLYLHSPTDFGTAYNVNSFVVTIFDRLFYAAAYSLTDQVLTVQYVFYFIKLFLLLLLPYLGFRKMADKESGILTPVLISLFYTFNTYTLIYWHVTAFSLTLILCYALAPLAFHYFRRTISADSDIKLAIGTSILIFFMSFALYLFIVFALFLLMYSALYVALNSERKGVILKRLAQISAFTTPLILYYLLVLYEMFAPSPLAVNATGGETYGLLKGGLLYQFLMWFSWGIYTSWEPRNIYSFAEYFRSPLSLAAPFVVYATVLWGIIKSKKTVTCGILLSILVVFFVFIKGPQEPFGFIYTFFINHVPGFRVFRSPDNKLGFGIILTLALLLLKVAPVYKKRLFQALLITVIVIQGWPVFTGKALQGENTEISRDRIVTLSEGYEELITFLSKSDQQGYILVIPPVEFGLYDFGADSHLGQDILQKLSPLPFVYLSKYSGMSIDTYNTLSTALGTGSYGALRQFPITYIIKRNDIRLSDEEKILEVSVPQSTEPVFSNNLFTVYAVPNSVPLVTSPGSTFRKVSPVQYNVNIRNPVENHRIVLNQNYNDNWKLFISNKESPQNFLFPPGKQIEAENVAGGGYPNTWVLNKDDLSSTGNQTVTIVIFYMLQTYLYVSLLLSATVLVVYLFYLMIFNDITIK